MSTGKSSDKNTRQFTPPTPSALSSWLANIGLLAIAVATLLPIVKIGLDYFRYIYAAGALLTLIGRILSARIYQGMPLRVRRLGRMELWAAIIFGVGTFFLFWHGAGPTDWLAFTLAGAALQSYSSIMLPRTIAKELK